MATAPRWYKTSEQLPEPNQKVVILRSTGEEMRGMFVGPEAPTKALWCDLHGNPHWGMPEFWRPDDTA